jgi:hypothetical protein
LLLFFSLEGRPVSGVVRKFKCPLKKMQPSCPCSRDLNWTSKGLKYKIKREKKILPSNQQVVRGPANYTVI